MLVHERLELMQYAGDQPISSCSCAVVGQTWVELLNEEQYAAKVSMGCYRDRRTSVMMQVHNPWASALRLPTLTPCRDALYYPRQSVTRILQASTEIGFQCAILPRSHIACSNACQQIGVRSRSSCCRSGFTLYRVPEAWGFYICRNGRAALRGGKQNSECSKIAG